MKRLFLIIFLLLTSVNILAATIYVMHDTEESSVRSLTFQLSKLLPVNTRLMPVRSALFMKNISFLRDDDVIVTVGAGSFRLACSVVSDGAIIAVFIGKEEYLNIQPQCSIPVSGVFSGAPLDKRLNILEAIWSDRKSLAVIYSDHLLVDEQEMMDLADQHGFIFRFLKTKTDRLSILKSVNFAIKDSELIFSLVDTQLYKNGLAQDILRLLFHMEKAMMGPSFAFVRAGSLFAVYSDSEAKLNALAERLIMWDTEEVLLDAAYPDQLKVSFNSYLIKSRGIVLPSSSYLRDKYGLCSETKCE